MPRTCCLVLSLAAILALAPGPMAEFDCATSTSILEVTTTDHSVEVTLENLLDEDQIVTLVISGQISSEPFTQEYPVELAPLETHQFNFAFEGTISNISVTLCDCRGTTESPDPVVPRRH